MSSIYNLIRQEIARRSLVDFVEYCNPEYIVPWYMKVVCRHLEMMLNAEIDRLMIFMPPGHAKTTYLSQYFPAYAYGKQPNLRMVATSNEAKFAQSNNRAIQRIIDSPEYKDIFPQTALFGKGSRISSSNTYLRNSDKFEIVNHRGFYKCAGIGGNISGQRADIGIIDDPIKSREVANSPILRNKVHDWYREVFRTRIVPPQGEGKFKREIIIQTRWHEDDLSGRLLEIAKADEDMVPWTVISFPAIAESNAPEYDHRQPGEALWPEFYPVEKLEKEKLEQGSSGWASLFQQRPTPGSGGIFKREWWKRWEVLPSLFDYLQSWDCAFKDTDESSHVVGQLWARSRHNKAERYLVDQVRAQMTFSGTVKAIRDFSAKHPEAQRILIEDKANGTAVIDTLKRDIPGIIPVNPKGGKVTRAHAVTAQAEAGNIFIPAKASWVGDFIEELSAFPSGKTDDQCDCLTQANAYYNSAGKMLAFTV